jgi:hypothetical protein
VLLDPYRHALAKITLPILLQMSRHTKTDLLAGGLLNEPNYLLLGGGLGGLLGHQDRLARGVALEAESEGLGGGAVGRPLFGKEMPPRFWTGCCLGRSAI